jgi:hypothetical protein
MAGPDPESIDLPQGDSAPAPQETPQDAGVAAIVAAQEASTREGSTEEGGAAGTGPGASGPAGAAGSSAEAAGLLVRAVGTLPDAERDQVYTWLLGRAMAGPFGAGQWPGRVREVNAQLLSLQQAGGPPPAQHIGQQVVPVRFSTAQHAQLRAWCTEHGFSMATVIRGLVARFLEGQMPARN